VDPGGPGGNGWKVGAGIRETDVWRWVRGLKGGKIVGERNTKKLDLY